MRHRSERRSRRRLNAASLADIDGVNAWTTGTAEWQGSCAVGPVFLRRTATFWVPGTSGPAGSRARPRQHEGGNVAGPLRTVGCGLIAFGSADSTLMTDGVPVWPGRGRRMFRTGRERRPVVRVPATHQHPGSRTDMRLIHHQCRPTGIRQGPGYILAARNCRPSASGFKSPRLFAQPRRRRERLDYGDG